MLCKGVPKTFQNLKAFEQRSQDTHSWVSLDFSRAFNAFLSIGELMHEFLQVLSSFFAPVSAVVTLLHLGHHTSMHAARISKCNRGTLPLLHVSASQSCPEAWKIIECQDVRMFR